MNTNWEKTEKNTGILKVEVEAEKVTVALDKAFKKVVNKINVPGFRKGKVPRAIFDARFGVESLYQDAIDIILPDAYSQAIDESGIEPIDRPEIDIEQFEKGKTFIFTAKVEVKPEVELGAYKGLEVEEKDFSVSEEQVELELKSAQQRSAELISVEEGTAENGDTAVIDFTGYLEGEKFEGGEAENHQLELGSGQFIPGFEDQVVGMSAGEEKDIEVTFPEEYQAEELKGKDVVFKVKLHEIKRKNLPELDDEFAKDVSEFETLAEYKEDLKKNLEEAKEKEQQQYRESVVIEKAAANATVEIPEPMVKHEVDHMLQDFAYRLRMQGMEMEQYFQFSGQTEEQLREQMSEDGKKRVLNNLVLEAITIEEKIEVSDEALEEEFNKLAEQYQRSVEEMKEIYKSNGNDEALRKDLTIRKAIDLLVETSQWVPAAEEADTEEATESEEKSEA
ncbi:trigger factor [Longirhabdus pacifica]|uniref:trigger factor n=1 Tax=Longirhabdus pacifica TaxID=2305227 RepID=UPI001008C412|nr:trigger factor [Longirhabdus pacifica]